jgi:fimbrial chaperone protein
MATAALAMRVSPMVLELTPSGSNSSGRIEVQNTFPTELAFETKVTRITFSDHGVATETPADADFLVFPPQSVVPTGGRQVIRIQYVGAPTLAASQAYYVSVNQLPVALAPNAAKGGAAQIQVVYNMKALVVVAPPNAQPNVTAVSAHAVTLHPAAEDGKPAPPPTPGVEVRLKNAGLRHAFMAGIGWRFEGRGTDGKPLRVELKPDELGHLVGTGYVGPGGSERVFQVPVPTAFGDAPIRVSFFR